MSTSKKFVTHSRSITFPRFPPYQEVREYLTSKAYFSSIECDPLQWDRAGHDPVFDLMYSQRKLQKADKILADKREWVKQEHKKIQMQWDDLYEKEMKLNHTFRKLSHFIKSNEEKRTRAMKIRDEDYQLRMQRTEEIENLEKKCNLVIKAQQEIDANIAALKIYEKYLNTVAGESEDLKNADHLINRYEALVNTRNLLGKRQDENLGELENARAKTSKMVEENKFKILGLNNVVADLRSRYNTAFREALHWENLVLAIKRHSYEKYQEIIEVRESSRNVYLQMCKRKGEMPKIREDDFEKQLIFIKETLKELRAVKMNAQGSLHSRKGVK
ncbi:coiled-coil domain-containing protein 42 [Zophobas morio]|uniref:coiled-coil domain-containing protein 42 n=1 Tax=Zophobas morio TaxID=2755281 RepID=UPI003082BBCE